MKSQSVFLCLSATFGWAVLLFLFHKDFFLHVVPLALYGGGVLLVMAPFPGENSRWIQIRAWVFLGAGTLLAALAPSWLRLFVSFALGVDMFVRLWLKLLRVRRLFRSDEVYNTVVDLSNGLYALWLVAVSTVEVRSWWMAVAVGMMQFGVVWLSLRLRLKERTLLLTEKQVRVMRTIARTNLRDPLEYDCSIENRKMMSLYKRAIAFMEEKKPFLDESFDLESFAKRIFTNKVYLSRTINALSGRNFRQFVNYYRVRYSTDLAKRDPRLKVEELAMMSGFHTVVSYNMAFRLFMNETPSEWLQRYRTSLSS